MCSVCSVYFIYCCLSSGSQVSQSGMNQVRSLMWIIPLVRLPVTFSAVSFQGEFPSVEDMTVAERALHEMRALIRLMQEEVAKAQEKKKKEQEEEEERRKQVELQAQQEAQKAAAQSAKEKAKRKGERIVLIQDCLQDHYMDITCSSNDSQICSSSVEGNRIVL